MELKESPVGDRNSYSYLMMMNDHMLYKGPLAFLNRLHANNTIVELYSSSDRKKKSRRQLRAIKGREGRLKKQKGKASM